jgi:hypothetical protein
MQLADPGAERLDQRKVRRVHVLRRFGHGAERLEVAREIVERE